MDKLMGLIIVFTVLASIVGLVALWRLADENGTYAPGEKGIAITGLIGWLIVIGWILGRIS